MQTNTTTASLTVGSTAFGNKDFIPEKFTCDGENISPGITIESIPPGTKSLALIVDDPDAPGGVFVHWLLWNVRPVEMIIENTAPGVQGTNGFGKQIYGGPCPPAGGPHRYFFKVYALDALMHIAAGSDRAALEKAMRGHILAEGEIIGMYKR